MSEQQTDLAAWPDDVLETAASWKNDGREVAIATVVTPGGRALVRLVAS